MAKMKVRSCWSRGRVMNLGSTLCWKWLAHLTALVARIGSSLVRPLRCYQHRDGPIIAAIRPTRHEAKISLDLRMSAETESTTVILLR